MAKGIIIIIIIIIINIIIIECKSSYRDQSCCKLWPNFDPPRALLDIKCHRCSLFIFHTISKTILDIFGKIGNHQLFKLPNLVDLSFPYWVNRDKERLRVFSFCFVIFSRHVSPHSWGWNQFSTPANLVLGAMYMTKVPRGLCVVPRGGCSSILEYQSKAAASVQWPCAGHTGCYHTHLSLKRNPPIPPKVKAPVKYLI